MRARAVPVRVIAVFRGRGKHSVVRDILIPATARILVEGRLLQHGLTFKRTGDRPVHSARRPTRKSYTQCSRLNGEQGHGLRRHGARVAMAKQQCQAKVESGTNKGKRCSKPVMRESGVCWHHRNKAGSAAGIRATGANGSSGEQKPGGVYGLRTTVAGNRPQSRLAAKLRGTVASYREMSEDDNNRDVPGAGHRGLTRQPGVQIPRKIGAPTSGMRHVHSV